jgi:hypothetical protein
VIHFVADRRRAGHPDRQEAAQLPAAEQHRGPADRRGRRRRWSRPALLDIIPDDGKKGYDVREVIAPGRCRADFLEVQAGYAMNIVVGFAPDQRPARVGIVANQPRCMAGVLDINASDKAARFIRFCNAFNIPLVTLVDVPGFMPGVAQEHGGIIRHGAKMLFAYSAATVPEDHRRAAQGLRRRVPRHVLQGPGCRPGVRLADRRDRRHGRRGRGRVVFRKEIDAAEHPAKSARSSSRSTARPSPTPTWRRNTAWWTRHRARADAAYVAQALEVLRTKREPRPAQEARPARDSAPPSHATPAAPAQRPEATEEDLLVIAAAVAAYLGVRARIRQVRLIQSTAWAQVGRATVHASHRIH